MNDKICSFAGHANISDKEEITLKLKEKIVNLIENENVTTFYSGGKGEFDCLCAYTVSKLRENYPFIKSHWVLAYMPKENDKNIEYMSKYLTILFIQI